ncbi:MAG: hypothetical protein BGN84_02080, partial [Afipia sp. 62-7]
MDDDKQDKAGIGDAAKRAPPTIDLDASDVTDTTPAAAETAAAPESASEESEARPDSDTASPPPTSSTSSILVSALAGAVAGGFVIGGATLAGWPSGSAPVSTAPLAENIAANKVDIDRLGTRVAKVEADAAKPAPRPAADPAIAARLDAVEKSVTALRNDLGAMRTQTEKTAAALNDMKSASPQAAMSGEPQGAPSVDMSAVEERLGKIERATAALSAAAAAPAPQPPADDSKIRRLDTLIDLDKAVRRGSPYVAELAAARSVAGENDALRTLDPFAQSGIPDADALSKELLGLLAQLTPKPEVQPAPSGIVERLQQSFARLVRIQRTDAQASGSVRVIARATAAAQRNDVNAAKHELLLLP